MLCRAALPRGSSGARVAIILRDKRLRLDIIIVPCLFSIVSFYCFVQRRVGRLSRADVKSGIVLVCDHSGVFFRVVLRENRLDKLPSFFLTPCRADLPRGC